MAEKRMKIVLATRNTGKVRELSALLAELPVELVAASEFSKAPDVEEDEPTLRGNARKKAWTLHRFTNLPALADDTGLEVEALNGAPGVRSARLAGDAADDAANRALLLHRMEGVDDRRARFRSVIAFADKDGVVFFEGLCPGRIVEQERGSGGFGYDPLFRPEGSPRTFAEMSSAEKNVVSHRARALRLVSSFLRARLEPAVL